MTADISSLLLSTTYGGGGFGGKMVGTEWLTIASIRFDVQDPTQCITFVLARFEPFAYQHDCRNRIDKSNS